MFSEDPKAFINQGLDGVVVANTRISNIDGDRGELVYAGYTLEELISRHCSYEDVVHLLLRDELPSSPEESQLFAADLASRRELSPALEAMIDAIPRNLDYMDALRIGISALSCEIDTSYPANEEQALNCIAKAPMILSRFYRLKTRQSILPSNSTYSHVANYLYMLTGNTLDTDRGVAYAKAFNVYFISTIEHGMNASTFTARVSTSTQSDLFSSVAAALSTLKGPLHGGAPLEVIHMLNAIGTKENAEPWIRNKLESREPIMGFGHRVYKTYDPRAKVLLRALFYLSGDGNSNNLEFILSVQEVAVRLLNEYKPGKNLYPNVEFGVAGVLHTIGLPEALYPATFGVSRCAGWSAHIIEQAQNNRLMRPTTYYSGLWPEDRKIKIITEENPDIIDRKPAHSTASNNSFWITQQSPLVTKTDPALNLSKKK